MSQGNIVFDFDGTIADSFEFVSGFLADKGGHSDWTLDERRRQFAGLTMREIADKLGIPIWQAIWMYFYGRRVMTRHLTEVKPFAGIVSAIKDLHEKGYALYALSANRENNIQLFLEQHKLAQYFSGMQGSASIIGKTLALRRLIWRHEIEKSECIYIGDEAGDMRAARRLHVRGIAVTWGYNKEPKLRIEKPYAIANSPSELLKIL